ncbi:MAG: hypothetical protein KatS3mg082_1739 [Nitrospiraceae bacterium]|nr:MAG: hypothetical protein KatS3mg082_1739 [Nitrospiraceae bacterium]
MITWKNLPGVDEAIAAAGHKVYWENDQLVVSDEKAVQAIIDTYDPLPYVKREKKRKIAEEAFERVRMLFPALASYDQLELEVERWLSIAAVARNPTPAYKKLIDTVVAARAAIAAVNSASTVADVETLVPVWPA